MKIFSKNYQIQSICKFFLPFFLFLLPWQTVYIIKEKFLNGSKWQYGTIQFFATEIILWGLFFCFFLWFLQKEKIFKKENFHWTVDRIFIFSLLLFVLYSGASFLWASVPEVAFFHSFFVLEAILLFVFLLFFPFSWKDSAQWFIFGAGIQSVLGLAQFFTQLTFASKWFGLASHPVAEPGTSVIVGETIGRILRSYGGFSHPNIFGGYLVCTIVVTILFLFQQKKQSIFFYSLLVLQLAALFFTFSRSAWIACVVWFGGLFAIWIFSRKKFQFNVNFIPKVTTLFVTFALVLCVFHFDLVSNRFAHSSSHEIRSTEERISGIQESFRIWKEHPWFGVGSGNYTAAAYLLNREKPGYEYQPVHNVPLLMLSELGILGIFLGAFAFFRLFKLIFYSEETNKKIFFSFFVLIFIVYVCLGLFDHYLFSSYTGLIFGIVFLGLTLRFFTQVFPSLYKKSSSVSGQFFS